MSKPQKLSEAPAVEQGRSSCSLEAGQPGEDLFKKSDLQVAVTYFSFKDSPHQSAVARQPSLSLLCCTTWLSLSPLLAVTLFMYEVAGLPLLLLPGTLPWSDFVIRFVLVLGFRLARPTYFNFLLLISDFQDTLISFFFCPLDSMPHFSCIYFVLFNFSFHSV